jgi:ferric-dicitrate binding protein FerR (iron transport regulator)
MTPSQLQDLLQRYQHGTCTPEERQAVEAWYEELGQQAQPPLHPEERQLLQATLWSRIAEQTILPGNAEPQDKARSWWQDTPVRWVAAAALAIGLSTAGISLLQSGAQPELVAQTKVAPSAPAAKIADEQLLYTNTSQQVATIRLADGSVVLLSPGSHLRYPKRFTAPNRRVHLVGEASFDVKHDTAHPFLVYTDKLVTTVLGTSFTVRAYAGKAQASVKVMRGKVRVTPRLPGAKADEVLPPMLASVVVRPNQQAVYSPAAQELRKELVAQPAVLVPQPFAFDDRPVAEVLTALEEAYGVDIVYDEQALTACTVSLVLKDESLFGKLAILCKTLGASYEVSDTQIVVHSRGCKN